MGDQKTYYFREKYERTCDALRNDIAKGIEQKIWHFLNYAPADDQDWSLAKTALIGYKEILIDFIGEKKQGAFTGRPALSYFLMLHNKIQELIEIIPHQPIPEIVK